jgi:cobyrinic acid a,c-diamide synthase
MFEKLSEGVKATIDIDKILEIADQAKPLMSDFEWKIEGREALRIGIAKDAAFNFYYQDALDLMTELFAVTWLPFSPLKDKALPGDLHGIYMGGGFPEIFADSLSKNTSFRASLLEELERGIPYIAECGGLMYLCKSLIDLEGKEHEMLGWLDGKTSMETRLQRFGYAKLTLSEDCILGLKGQSINIHEFHRSKAQVNEKQRYILEKNRDQRLIKSWTCGFEKGNGLAGYAHFNFASNLDFAKAWLDRCIDYKHRLTVRL